MNDDAVMAQQRYQTGRDQARADYGAVPVILEAFPEGDPVRVKIRESARATLVGRGYLTADELATLPVKEAITVVLKRLRGEASGAE